MSTQVIAAPDPRLRMKSQPISNVDNQCRMLMDHMIDLVRSQNALGLAAVQIGVGVRILVVNVGKEGQAPVPLFLVNPEIIRRSRQRVISEESCLSVPGYVGLIQRAHEVTVRYLDYHGMPSERRATGLLAVCIQHEMNQLWLSIDVQWALRETLETMAEDGYGTDLGQQGTVITDF
jgi:peptide deformylase